MLLPSGMAWPWSNPDISRPRNGSTNCTRPRSRAACGFFSITTAPAISLRPTRSPRGWQARPTLRRSTRTPSSARWEPSPAMSMDMSRLPPPPAGRPTRRSGASGGGPMDRDPKLGAVGAVACDVHGHVGAATSTGGLTNKAVGRVGDTPIIGAGCYAANTSCAVSCTGTGEAFIKIAAAHDLAALIEYPPLNLADAADCVVQDKLVRLGGRGGLVAVDARGNVVLPFNTEGMYRSYTPAGQPPPTHP